MQFDVLYELKQKHLVPRLRVLPNPRYVQDVKMTPNEK